MRVFIAVNLSTVIKEELQQMQEALSKRTTGFRWVKPELLHITLKFIGEVSPDFVSSLSSPFMEFAEKHEPFKLSFKGLGCFPNVHRPRVIWIGVEKGAVELSELSEGINEIVANLQLHDRDQPGKKGKEGNKKEGKFIPHLTLGRRKKEGPVSLDKGLFEEEWYCANDLHVDGFYIMQSTLKPSGPIYTPLEKIML